MPTPAPRVYAGVEGDQRVAERRARLMAAGLDLLGSAEGDPTLSVRAVCRRVWLTRQQVEGLQVEADPDNLEREEPFVVLSRREPVL